jgi:hypothetical protein
MIQIIPNFFNNFDFIKDSFKKIPLYNKEEYNKNFNDTQNWPGKRSGSLYYSAKFLTLFFNETLERHGVLKNPLLNFKQSLYLHLRLDEDEEKDWIHRDQCIYSAIVYLSNTNVNSGTYFFAEDKKTITHKVGFIQNTCLFFNANLLHKSALNFGKNLSDGRLTLNVFFT